jgi:hypothetical protein
MRMRIRDTGIFLTLDPGSGMEKIRIRDKHPGSATLEKQLGNCNLHAGGSLASCGRMSPCLWGPAPPRRKCRTYPPQWTAPASSK